MLLFSLLTVTSIKCLNSKEIITLTKEREEEKYQTASFQ